MRGRYYCAPLVMTRFSVCAVCASAFNEFTMQLRC